MIATAEAKVDKDLANKRIPVTKHFNAKPETMWRAWTQPEIPDQWWAPNVERCTKRDEYPDGRQFVGFGVQPDVYIENTVEDLIKGTDSTLKKGVEVVWKKK